MGLAGLSAVWSVLLLGLHIGRSGGAVVCPSWTRCWSCVDNFRDADGACAWDPATTQCQQSSLVTDGVTSITDCNPRTGYLVSEAACFTRAEANGVTDALALGLAACQTEGGGYTCSGACQTMLQCVSNAVEEHSGEVCMTDSSSGMIVDCSPSAWRVECESTFPTCTRACEAGAVARLGIGSIALLVSIVIANVLV